MKKLICVTLVLLAMLGCLPACNFTTNLSGAAAGDAESAPKVEEMMKALAGKEIDDAKALMHPEVAEDADAAISQLSDFLDGRKATGIEMEDISVRSSAGTGGKTRQEQAIYQVTLDDGEVIYLSATYFSNSSGSGFVSFQIVLGAI